jgi:hypothetical protein
MPPPPLSHHDILQLVGPFARRGHHVDLHASDRLKRRLVFKPLSAATTPQQDALQQGVHATLQLDSLGTGTLVLTRTLTWPAGNVGGPSDTATPPRASVEAVGPDAAELLAQIEGFDADRHFSAGPGFVIARSYVLQGGRAAPAGAKSGSSTAAAPNGAGPRWSAELTRGVVHLADLTMTMTVPRVRNLAADIALAEGGGAVMDLPEDLLAVLGWNWARLVYSADGWGSKMRLRGSGTRRTRNAEAALLQAAPHLVRTLAEPPARFHDRHRAARWGVCLRRSIPLLTTVSLLASLVSLRHLDLSSKPGLVMLLYHLPTALIVLSFCAQELPRFEIPPWPRRNAAPDWWRTRATPPPPAAPAEALPSA